MDFAISYLTNVWALVDQVLSQPELYLLSFAIWSFLLGGSDNESLDEAHLTRSGQQLSRSF